MSHFSVMVIGPNVEAQLQPYHEFECTGTDDQYVVELDITEEVRDEYMKATKTRLRLPDGSLTSFFDLKGNWKSAFSKEEEDNTIPTLRRRTYFVPEGHEKVDVPARECMTFEEFVAEEYSKEELEHGHTPDFEKKHKYGYAQLDVNGALVKLVKRTNPNKHWDWYVVGGRWSQFFKLKPGKKGTTNPPYHSPFSREPKPEIDPGRADIALLQDIDVDSMRWESAMKYGERWDKMMRIVGATGNNWISWKKAREIFTVEGKTDYKQARELYHEQPAIAALTASKDDDFLFDIDDDLTKSREEYVMMGSDRGFSCFAIVKDGQWYQRGNMGWFGCVSDESDIGAWNKRVAELVNGLPGDTLLTIVDCHI